MILASNLTVSGSSTTIQPLKISDEEYEVYSAVISKMFAGGKVTFDSGAEVKLLVINDHTLNSSLRADHVEHRSWEYLKGFFPEVSQEMLNDFAAKNKETYQLKDNFKVELKRTLIKKGEIEQMFKDSENGWKKFYQSFPNSGGFVGFSRVSFDDGNKQALVYMEHNCRDLCASGHFLLLRKSEEGWIVVKKFMPWIS
jgi:hypothetical protein